MIETSNSLGTFLTDVINQIRESIILHQTDVSGATGVTSCLERIQYEAPALWLHFSDPDVTSIFITAPQAEIKARIFIVLHKIPDATNKI